jgi:TM2 domain-containing membrane protein YozV
MNKCKSCGSLFQSNLTSCPVCHTSLIPLPSKATDDFTQHYNPLANNVELVRLKSRLLTVILAILLGSTGAHLYYLGYFRRGLFLLIFNGLALTLSLLFPLLFGIIGITVIAVSHLMSGLFYLLNQDAKDARGDFLQ